MQSKAYILTAFLCGAGVLCAQDPSAQTPSAQPPPAQAPAGTSTSTSPDQSGNSAGTYVRRFSIGATLSVVGLSLISGGSNTVTNSTTVSTAYDASSVSSRIGYGITGQVAVTDRFSVVVGGYLRKIGYTLNTTVTTTTETSLNGVLTSTSSSTSTNVNGNVTCCTDTPTAPQHRTAPGAVVGAGFQLIDPVGIRVIPEIRYTRWLQQTYDVGTTHTQRNQIEAALTLSF